MKAPALNEPGKGPLELLEEGTHLLRRLPAADWLAYYGGTLPFVLGALYFWSDMSRSADADQRLGAAALGLALLFLWMKTGQALFGQRLLARLCGRPPVRLTARGCAALAASQARVQPWGLLVLPVALFLLVPFGWAYAYYQNVTVLGRDAGEAGRLSRRAWDQARLWPRSNHYALATLHLFGWFVLLNLVTGTLAVPYLLKTLLGIATPFSASVGAMLNTTFFAAMIGLTYLCLDPLVKAFYVLRCFYGEALRSGQDLRTELRAHQLEEDAAPADGGAPGRARAALLALILGSLIGLTGPTQAAAAAAPGIGPDELDRAIEDVITQREYAWRLPRERPPAAQPEAEGWRAWLKQTAAGVGEWLGEIRRAIGRWLERFSRRPESSPAVPLARWAGYLHTLLMFLLVALAALLAVLVLRAWRRRRTPREELLATTAPAVPDLADESVSADQLPEDGWRRLARELMGQGEWRLALRALYLSSLASLAERGLITLARFKSNRDYEQELERRAHALPEVVLLFGHNVQVINRTWYGLHPVNPELLQQFETNVERLRTSA